MLFNEVYHGSPKKRIVSHPVRHTRTRKKQIIFDQKSFHASPQYWIALAYTYTPTSFEFEGQEIYYNVEIDLYENKKEVIIHGIDSLEKSLKALYQKGGYVSSFSQKDFFHVQGLGNLECITDKKLKAKKVMYTNNPVQRMRDLDIRFRFIDLSDNRNAERRNIKEKGLFNS